MPKNRVLFGKGHICYKEENFQVGLRQDCKQAVWELPEGTQYWHKLVNVLPGCWKWASYTDICCTIAQRIQIMTCLTILKCWCHSHAPKKNKTNTAVYKLPSSNSNAFQKNVTMINNFANNFHRVSGSISDVNVFCCGHAGQKQSMQGDRKQTEKIRDLSATKSSSQNEQFRNRKKEGIKKTLPAPNSSQQDQRMQQLT